MKGVRLESFQALPLFLLIISGRALGSRQLESEVGIEPAMGFCLALNLANGVVLAATK